MRKILLAAMAAGLLASAFTATAAAAPKVGDHCVGLIGQKGQAPKVTCAATADAPELKAAAAAGTPLMTWYDNGHYDTGRGSYTWLGYYGTCDHDGYSVNLPSEIPSWNHRISSWHMHGSCYTGSMWHNASGDTQFWQGDIASVGEWFGWQFEDHVEGFQIQSDW
ncbi:hypothetical protein Lesp02_52800 [Lentzea sp. NBRC 105346]|uniref:hypothetical protein n=1 Tax=Lentzea sp. NBRC 105346 TaxID=3032205 RepID=UPI0024A34C77|nr:hypothetical protein [Lentzea sp. NBRC 105346]GLZ33092.1 hypothetical protein Lesp02_52800 [Lentzea sp. NBRC 105346]